MRAGLPLLHDAFLSHYQTDRQARAKALGQRHDIRLHIPVLTGKHLAAATYARLHFVENQQNAVAIAQLAQARQKSVGRYYVATLALNRLDQDRGDFAGRNVADEQAVLNIVKYGLTLIVAREQRMVRIRKRHVGDARHRGAALLLGLLTGSKSERPHRAPVKTAEKTNESRTSTNVARQFQCTFHRFSAGLAEKTEHRLAHR